MGFGRKGNGDEKGKERHLKPVKDYKGKRRAIDPNESFQHPHVTGETRPAEIKKMIQKAEKDNDAEMLRILRERHGK
jgi:hypothetical protein